MSRDGIGLTILKIGCTIQDDLTRRWVLERSVSGSGLTMGCIKGCVNYVTKVPHVRDREQALWFLSEFWNGIDLIGLNGFFFLGC